MKPAPPSTPDSFYAVIWVVYLLPPHLGQKSNNVQGQAEAFGSRGIWVWLHGKRSQVLGSWGEGGDQDQELPPEPASFSQVALLILDRAGGTFGGQPSCLQLRALPGFPSSQPCLPLGPIPFGWLIFCLGQREANLGCYTS